MSFFVFFKQIKEADNLKTRKEKMWIIVPVMTFPHILIFNYIFHFFICIYYNTMNYFFCGIIFLAVTVVLTIFSKKQLNSLITCFFSVLAFPSFLALGIWMITENYNSVKVSKRPAPTLASCFFLSLMNLFSIWSFLVLGGVIKPSENKEKSQKSTVSVKLSE
ncbi:uncharacterized protein CELE_F36H2.6 [Caenorhabditis elegans]|uniref:Transmembrane protein n=1 Tax=Caenorhabditis elegans TaxID=6239 RepID=C6KRM9_CAEEL|nr:Transmembrane protein [Caenorhabditis elegans]CAZ65497.1 Transmembrane protein [Caenorhabditis elegans]|eukprot:NP_001251036.1 Uncharacterized protein CELE_F36H2.6 [Caenorhabditis elegans]